MKTYRVACTAGHAYDVAVWLVNGEGWLARMTDNPIASGDDERTAVINACNEHIHIAEVRGPGEATTAERVEAVERERFDAAHKAEEWEESHSIEKARADAVVADVARLRVELARVERVTVERCMEACGELVGTFGNLVDSDGGTATLLFEGELEEVMFDNEEEAANAEAGARACCEALRALLPEVPRG